MTMPELATLVQEKLKIHIAIINNGYLGMVRQWQEFSTSVITSDAAAESGLWSTGRCVRHPRHYGDAAFGGGARRSVRREHDGPVLMNFKVEQEDSVYPMVATGAALHEMIRRPSPIVESAVEE